MRVQSRDRERTHSSRLRGRKRSSSETGGERMVSRRRGAWDSDSGGVADDDRCWIYFSLSVAMLLGVVYSADAKRPTTGELAGKGFLRTGDEAGDCCVWERKAAKLCTAMVASDEAFGLDAEGEDWMEGAPSPGRLGGSAACILLTLCSPAKKSWSCTNRGPRERWRRARSPTRLSGCRKKGRRRAESGA